MRIEPDFYDRYEPVILVVLLLIAVVAFVVFVGMMNSEPVYDIYDCEGNITDDKVSCVTCCDIRGENYCFPMPDTRKELLCDTLRV